MLSRVPGIGTYNVAIMRKGSLLASVIKDDFTERGGSRDRQELVKREKGN